MVLYVVEPGSRLAGQVVSVADRVSEVSYLYDTGDAGGGHPLESGWAVSTRDPHAIELSEKGDPDVLRDSRLGGVGEAPLPRRPVPFGVEALQAQQRAAGDSAEARSLRRGLGRKHLGHERKVRGAAHFHTFGEEQDVTSDVSSPGMEELRRRLRALRLEKR